MATQAKPIQRATQRRKLKPRAFRTEPQAILGWVGGSIHIDLPRKPPGRDGQVEGRKHQRTIAEAEIRLHRRLTHMARGDTAEGKPQFSIQRLQRRDGDSNIGNDAAIA